MNQKGFTLIELLIVIAIVGIIAAIGFGAVVDNRGATENRAFENAKAFADTNNITYKRLSCAGDSDRDGYGTCAMVTDDGEKIMLNCPTNLVDTKVFGANGCKEVFFNMNVTGNGI